MGLEVMSSTLQERKAGKQPPSNLSLPAFVLHSSTLYSPVSKLGVFGFDITGEAFGDPLYIHRQSCYLFGRERRVVDVPTDHPSCSKQHAVLQYRCATTESTILLLIFKKSSSPCQQARIACLSAY